MATVNIDNQPYEMDPKQNLLHGCLSLGLEPAVFLLAPGPALGGRLPPVRRQAVQGRSGHARQDRHGLHDARRRRHAHLDSGSGGAEFRAAIIEWLMLNHPHDCPVCDEGGECHLQDMTVMTGHDYRRYRFEKRTYRNQYLGPFINHEMNRCIQCYRCVRFYRDYAGGHDLDVFALRNIVFLRPRPRRRAGERIQRQPGGGLPHGRVHRRHAETALHAQVGPANGSFGLRALRAGLQHHPGERYGMLRRVVNRYNGEVNGYFLCDRGRFGYEFVNSERRIRQPLRKGKRSLPRRPRSATCESLRRGRRSASVRRARRSRAIRIAIARW